MWRKGEKLKRRRQIQDKHQQGFYVRGQPIEQGKTKIQAKEEKREEFKKYKQLSEEDKLKHKRAAFKKALKEPQKKFTPDPVRYGGDIY